MSVFELQAPELGWFFSILPPNGLDRSLHAPVFIGLLLLSLFKELFGWSYAGIVVPGYLASVVVVAPVTGVLVLSEAIAAYLLAAALGRWLPATGAWSSFFGRERFLLLILTALFMRLWVEASLVPLAVQRFELGHSRELYSIGLVLVPLLANSFWNAGVTVALPRVLLITGMTYVVVEFGLTRHTNFSIARFQVANESVSLQFLDSPHAYIILVTGAVLAARDNVRYGWDYNGILVPALLAIACYQPTKLLTTIAEGLIVLQLSKWVTARGPLSKLLIVGSRRMVVAFAVGFLFKWVTGYLLFFFLPDLRMVDYFGFGYLLPTLLAVKMWNTGRVGVTVMPTLQVAVTAFVVGNGIGIGLRLVDGSTGATELRTTASLTAAPISLELMLGDSAPDPDPPGALSMQRSHAQHALAVLREALEMPSKEQGFAAAWPSSLSVSRRSSGWWTIVPRALDPNADPVAPRLAFKLPAHEANPWAIVIDEPETGSPAFVLAEQLANQLRARAIVVRSRIATSRGHDTAFIEAASELLSIERLLVLRLRGAGPQLSSVGGLPQGLSVSALAELLESDIDLRWRAAARSNDPIANAVYLSVPRALVEARSASWWGAPDVVTWQGPPETAIREHIGWLTTETPGAYAPPRIEELRLFGRSVLPALVNEERIGPSPWQRAVAARLGYRFAHVTRSDAWGLFEPAGPARAGHATIIVRQRIATALGTEPRILVEVPAPRWEEGIVNASLALFAGLRAEAVLLAGALPNAAPGGEADMRRRQSVQSYYQHAHEVWLQAGRHAVGVRGLAADGRAEADAMVAFQAPESSPLAGPAWTRTVVRVLKDNALSLGVVDGGLETAAYSGLGNPAMSYAHTFAQDQMMLVWLSADARGVLSGVRDHPLTAERVARLGERVREVPVGETVVRWARCRQRPETAQERASCEWVGPCSSDAPARALFEYAQSNNPYDLIYALSPRSGCRAVVVRDVESRQLWGVVPTGSRIVAVPLRGQPVGSTPGVITEPERVEGALSLGLTALTVEMES